MSELKPLTELQTEEIMIVETKNELTKTKLLLRLATRQFLRATNDKTIEQTKMVLEGKVRMFEKTIADLEDFHKEDLAKAEKEGDTGSADKGD